MIAYLFLLVCLFQDDVPYRAEETFNIKFELDFKKRSNPDAEDLALPQTSSTSYDRHDSSPLPHMKLILEVLKLDSLEVKLKIVRDNSVNVAKRKVESGTKITIISAFVDDIKDQIQGYQHTIYFLDKEGIKLSKIVIEFDDGGIYSVNGKKKGKI